MTLRRMICKSLIHVKRGSRAVDLRGIEIFKDDERKEIVRLTLTLFILIATSSNRLLSAFTANDLLIIARFYVASAAFLVIYYACIMLNSLNHGRLLFKWLDVILFLNIFVTVAVLILLALPFLFSDRLFVWLGNLMYFNALLGFLCGLYSLGDFVLSVKEKLCQSCS